MLWKGFQRPQRVEVDLDTLSGAYGRFSAQPFERGFATTVGNALRRCLLSSIEGAAIAAVQLEGVLHEFSSIPGVVQDMTDLTLNLKQIPIRLHSDEPKMVSLDVTGPGEVVAGQLVGDSQVEVCDPDAPIATINEEGHLKLQAQVKNGRGYISAEQNFDESMGIGWIPLDSSHSPVRRVNYSVEAARGRPGYGLRASGDRGLDQRHDHAGRGACRWRRPCSRITSRSSSSRKRLLAEEFRTVHVPCRDFRASRVC